MKEENIKLQEVQEFMKHLQQEKERRKRKTLLDED